MKSEWGNNPMASLSKQVCLVELLIYAILQFVMSKFDILRPTESCHTDLHRDRHFLVSSYGLFPISMGFDNYVDLSSLRRGNDVSSKVYLAISGSDSFDEEDEPQSPSGNRHLSDAKTTKKRGSLVFTLMQELA